MNLLREKIQIQAPKRGAVISTTSGFSDSLGPFEKREVPYGAVTLYVAAGCFMIGAPPGAPAEAPAIPAAPAVADPTDRAVAIQATIKTLVERGHKEDFTDNGQPRVSAVRRVAEFDVTKEEVADAFLVVVADDELTD
jgi:hypothetical protein